MSVLHSFLEVAYTLLALALPIALIWCILRIINELRRSGRESSEQARRSTIAGAALELGAQAILDVFGTMAIIVLLLVLLINVWFATIPYGHTHGWW